MMKHAGSRPRIVPPLAASALLVMACSATAQKNVDCFDCHEDKDLFGERRGKEISVYVSPRGYAGSVHAKIDCVDCHEDLYGSELPHAEDVAPVDCSLCHYDIAESHARGLHGKALAAGNKLAPSCTTCHGTHEILSREDPASRTSITKVPLLCGQCHHEGEPISLTPDIPWADLQQNYSLRIHGEGLFKKGLTVTAVCTSCHKAHEILPHTDPASSIHATNVAETCMQCHAQVEDVHREVVDRRLWLEEPHKIPACVDCHAPHEIRNVFYPAGIANKNCMECHGKEDLESVRHGETISLWVDEFAHSGSAHGQVACSQCHVDATPSLERPCETIVSKVDCGVCHAEEVHIYEESTHGQLHAEGDPFAPTCLSCHEKHATLGHDDPRSRTFARNVPNLCGQCHGAGRVASPQIEPGVPGILESYETSIHGKGLRKSGLVVAATCVDCHGAHHQRPAEDPLSTVHPDNIADTCGNCHHGIQETFKTSIHWPENTHTDDELPGCADCHSSHSISRTDEGKFRFQMMNQCGRCHEEEASTFFDTYHGKVSRLGSAGAAKCSDCHGTHDILPTVNPESRLHPRNVVDTCAQCHSGAHPRFTGYLTHATHHDSERYPYLFWSFWGMTALIVGTMTFALLHTLAWLWRLWRTRPHWIHHKRQPGDRNYVRFTRLQRSLHLVMIVSFFTLALTGMALKFSHMAWAGVISYMLGGSEGMGILHRLGAIMLMTVVALHLWDVRRMKKADGLTWWQMIRHPEGIIFNGNDLKEFKASMKWFFGRGPRPSYGRYTYWEKFDYFAVFWGVVVIGCSGLVLWFPEFFTRFLPGWSVNVATIVHSDEALLAVAFIFTVHFFNTHFRPDKFPMDTGIFTGRVPLEELKYDKPREYENAVKQEKLDQNLVPPVSDGFKRAVKIFGFVALAIGLILVGLILYAMLFGYR